MKKFKTGLSLTLALVLVLSVAVYAEPAEETVIEEKAAETLAEDVPELPSPENMAADPAPAAEDACAETPAPEDIVPAEDIVPTEATTPAEDAVPAEATAPAEPFIEDQPEAPLNGDTVVDSGSAGENATWTLTGSGDDLTMTISGNGAMTDFQMYRAPWYESYRTKIKAIIVEEGITTIGNASFCDCSNATQLSLPDSLKEVGTYAFYRCAKLDPIVIPNGVTTLKSGAFNGCKSLKTVAIPESMTGTGDHSFTSCTSLKSVTIPDTVTKIDYASFWGCTSLTDITIPDGVTCIDGLAFAECSSLAGLEIPDGVTSIGEFAFRGCTAFTNIELPDSVTDISYAVFEKCSNLKSIKLPKGLTEIGIYTFQDCSSLTNITLPENLTHLGSGTFKGCTGLTSVTVPDGVTDIGAETFFGCSSLTSISLPEDVTGLGDYAFCRCGGLTEITIPKAVTHIDRGAFFACTGLTDITIPEGVTKIGPNAFQECSHLTSVTIPASVKKMEYDNFSRCTSLTSVYFNGSRKAWEALKVSLPSGATVIFPNEADVLRLFGSNRYKTALAIANRLKELNGGAQFGSIVLATGNDYPDALAGGYLANLKKAPLILIRSQSKTSHKDNKMVASWIKANLKKDGTIYVLGSTAAVPAAHVNAVKSGFKVKRLGGKNRFGTDIEILKAAGVKSGKKTFIVTTGYDYPDALCASALNYPLLILNTKKNILTAEQKTYLSGVKNSTFYLIGPKSVVSSDLEKALKSYGTVKRISTNSNPVNRSVQTAQLFTPDAKAAALAISTDYPDGLCGGVLANKLGAPLLLVKSGESTVVNYVKTQEILTGLVYGSSKGAVPDSAVEKVFPTVYEIALLEYK